MRRLALTCLGLLLSLGGASVAAGHSVAQPVCPTLDTWTLTKTDGPFVSGGGSKISCYYNQTRITDTATINGAWIQTTADSQAYTTFACKPAAPAAGSYYKNYISGKSLWAETDITVGGGSSSAEVVATYQANLARLEKSALALLTSEELVARACPGAATTTTTTTTLNGGHPGGTLLANNSVHATTASVRTHQSLVKSHSYRVVVSGTVGVHRGVHNEFDAFYCYRTADLNGDGKPDCSPPSFFNMICVGTQKVRFDINHCVGLDTLAGKTGKVAYSPSHVYSLTIKGVSGPITFGIRDASLADASGGWTVKIYDLG